MNNLYTIMKYESLMLLRTWKFWILAIIGMFFPIMTNVVFILMRKFGDSGGPVWGGLDGSAPFMLFYMYNIVQTVIVIFLTSDFREKDQKEQVHEVMCSRSMTNLEYIWGKYLGIIVPLMILTTVIISILSTVNFFVNGFWALDHYLYNFFVLNMPSLLFITAFIIFMSSLLKNTAVVFITVAAYTVASVYFCGDNFLTGNKLWLYLDYLGWFLPLFPSDLVGVYQSQFVLIQRLFYLALGGIFIGLTIIFFYPRLRQSRIWTMSTVLGVIVCAGVAGGILYNTVNEELQRQVFKSAIIESAKNTEQELGWKIRGYDLDYKMFDGNIPIKAVAEVTFEKEETAGQTIQLVLNNGLNITSITDESNTELSFDRSGIDLFIAVENAPANQPYKLRITYSGTISEKPLFLTKSKEDEGEFNKEMPTVDNVPVILSETFSYLFPESMWYPQLYNPYSFEYPDKRPTSFFGGKWSFELPAHLTAVSQGLLVSVDSISSRRTYFYESEYPIDRLSLNTGEYRKYSTEIDGLTYQLYVSNEHNALVDFFTDVKEEVIVIIRDAMRGITEITGLEYPYSTLTYVEVPIIIQWYQDNGLHTEMVSQPGVVMASEDNLMKSYKERFERKKRRAERRNLEKSDIEFKKEIFREMIIDDMFSENWWSRSKMPTPIASFWSHQFEFSGKNYPLYEYYFDKYLEQLIAEEIEFYITNQAKDETIGDGLSSYEIQRLYDVPVDTLYYLIRNYPLNELKPDPESPNYHAVMKYKSGKLNNILRELITPDKFKNVLLQFRNERAYMENSVEDFQRVSERITESDLTWFFDDWLKGNGFPGYYITKLDAFKLKGGRNGVQYLVEVRIKNGEPDAGYLKVSLRTKDDQVIKRSEIRGDQELEFGFLVEDFPERIGINPIFSQNVDNIYKKVRVPEQFDRKKAWEGVRVVESLADEVETITIDDLDKGFLVIASNKSNYLRPSYGEEEWRIRNSNGAFGKYKNTYRRKDSNSGISSAQWSTPIENSGIYEVQAFIFKGYSDWEKRYIKRDVARVFKYNITHSDGTDMAELEWDPLPEGWNVIGRYFFEEGSTAIVEFDSNVDGRLYADAVRFVPVKVIAKPEDGSN